MKPVSGLTFLALLVGLALCLVPPAGAAVPPDWTQQSVTTATPGSVAVDDKGVWTIEGAGDFSWTKNTAGATTDSFEFVFKTLTGDGSVTTRLLGPEALGDAAKVGVMVREDVDDAGSKMLTLQRSGGGLGGESFLRAITGERRGKDRKMCPDGDANLFAPAQLPLWLKIERRGNGFTPYASTDGTFWIPVGRTQRIPMKSEIAAGVFVASGSDDELQTATFDGTVTDVSGRLLKPEEAAPLQPNPLLVLSGENQVTLSWERVNHLGKEADGYIVYKGKVGSNDLTRIAELTGDQTGTIDTTIKSGEIARYRVTTVVKVGAAGDKALESQTLTNLLYTVSGAPNPPVSIGDRLYHATVLDCGGNHELTDKPGSASIDANGVITLTFSGWDIQQEADGGEALLTPVSGDFAFTARVLGVPTRTNGRAADEWAKAGIIVRETPMAESRYVAMLVTPQHGLRSAHRRTFNAGQSYDNGAPGWGAPDFPLYLRLQRRGSIISVFTSEDGTTFTPTGDEETVDLTDLPPNVYVGFAGTAGGVQLPITQARFDQVTLTTP